MGHVCRESPTELCLAAWGCWGAEMDKGSRATRAESPESQEWQGTCPSGCGSLWLCGWGLNDFNCVEEEHARPLLICLNKDLETVQMGASSRVGVSPGEVRACA